LRDKPGKAAPWSFELFLGLTLNVLIRTKSGSYAILVKMDMIGHAHRMNSGFQVIQKPKSLKERVKRHEAD